MSDELVDVTIRMPKEWAEYFCGWWWDGGGEWGFIQDQVYNPEFDCNIQTPTCGLHNYYDEGQRLIVHSDQPITPEQMKL